mgnify:CR=1 FL=1
MRLAGETSAEGTETSASEWSAWALSASSDFAQHHPLWFLLMDLGGLGVIVVVVLFEADLFRLYEQRRMRLRGYGQLEGDGGEDGGDGGSVPQRRPLLRSVRGLG